MEQQKSRYLRKISTWNSVSDFKCINCVLGSKIINMVCVHLLRPVQMQEKGNQTDIDFRFLPYGEKLLSYQEFVGEATDSGLNWATKKSVDEYKQLMVSEAWLKLGQFKGLYQ